MVPRAGGPYRLPVIYSVTTQYVTHSDCTIEGASLLQHCESLLFQNTSSGDESKTSSRKPKRHPFTLAYERAELYLEPDADGEGIHVAAASGVDEVGSARGAEHGGVEGVVEHPEGPGRRGNRGHRRDEKY